MESTDTTFKPTPGPWETNGAEVTALGGLLHVCDVVKWARGIPMNRETESNALLIAVAGTVYHETGKTPSQLAKENKELLDALESVVGYAADCAWDRNERPSLIDDAEKLIAKAKGNGEDEC